TMPGSGTPFTVPVSKDDTADTVAGKVRDFINGVGNGAMAVNVKGFFDVSASGANVTFMKKQQAANDPTMTMSVTNGTRSGINSLSADTTAGVAPPVTTQVETLTVNTGVSSPGDITVRVT